MFALRLSSLLKIGDWLRNLVVKPRRKLVESVPVPFFQLVARRTAFSLMEMLAGITILGVLAAVVIPRITVNKATTTKQACEVNKGHINVQVQLWKRQNGSWPANNMSNMLPTSTPAQYNYFPDGLPVCPVDGTAYTLDSTTHEVSGHAH